MKINCPACGTPVIRAREDLGGDITLDAPALDPTAEITHVLGGRSTFTLYETTRSAAWRTPLHLRHRPAGSRPRETVHAEHRCSAMMEP